MISTSQKTKELKSTNRKGSQFQNSSLLIQEEMSLESRRNSSWYCFSGWSNFEICSFVLLRIGEV